MTFKLEPHKLTPAKILLCPEDKDAILCHTVVLTKYGYTSRRLKKASP